MGLCLIYSNPVMAGLIIQQMNEMLQHPAPGTLNIIIKRTIATMTRGTKCCILLQYLQTAFLMITGLAASQLKFTKIFWGVYPLVSPLNMDLINHMANVANAQCYGTPLLER